MSRAPNPGRSRPAVPSDYFGLLEDIKQRVHRTQVRAALAANSELIALYWDIGRLILARQAKEGWGAKVIDRLAADLQKAFPGKQGFSPRSLKYMRAFAVAWPEVVFVQRPVAQIEAGAVVQGALAPFPDTSPTIVQRAVAQLPWRHHTVLLNKLATTEDRLWYAAKAVEHGWSGDLLALQIQSGLLRRQGKAATNFRKTLPPAHSELAQAITKDPYLFDFLTLTEAANERAVEDCLLVQVGKVPELRANGPASNQPRATPWATSPHDPSPEGAAQPYADGSPLQGSSRFSPSAQGVALCWHGSRRWRCGGGQP